MTQIHQFGPKAARLLVDDKCVATISENVMYRDPFFCGPRDYVGHMLTDGTREYFATWQDACDWLAELDKRRVA